MAKVIAPFKIVGTLDDMVFYLDQENNNLVKTKGKSGITTKQFMENPIFTKARNHGKEFGRCSKMSQNFRRIAHFFNNRAKDGSYAGRANKLMLDISYEDESSQPEERTVEKGLQSAEARTYFIGFEGNKTRPLNKVLKTDWNWDESTGELTITDFNPLQHIDWPDTAQKVHIAAAYANWNYLEKTFHTEYSSEIVMEKEDTTQDIILKTAQPEGEHLRLAFLFIGFSLQDRKKCKELKRSNNTVSILWSK